MDYNIKLALAIVSGVIFSLFFVILALIVPTHEKVVVKNFEKPKTRVGKISKAMREGFGQE